MNQFEGTLVRLIFEDKVSGYRIYAVESDDPSLMRNKYFNITVKGYLPELKKNQTYTFLLTEPVSEDPKFGPSYDNVVIVLKMPESMKETESFLTSLIGKSRSKSLISVYPNIIELILEDKEDEIDLNNVKGVKEKSYQKIKKKVLENFKYFNIISHFGDVFSLNVIMKLFDQFHNEAQVLEQLKVDPYRALCLLDRIGFKRADQLILKTIETDKKAGIEPRFDENIIESKERLVFYIQYLLENLSGHTYDYLNRIEKECENLLSEAFHHFDEAIEDPIFYVEEDKIALTEIYELEQWIGERLNDSNDSISSMDYHGPYDIYRYQDDILLDETQLSLLPLVVNHQISCLFGVAGSGKTTILKALLTLMNDQNKIVYLSSPTGRAANILTEKSGQVAKTIHMMLGVSKDGFIYHETNKLPADLVVVDEASMLDLSLFKSLLQAINFRTTKLLLVGDPQQLPSVGIGNVFEDLRLSHLPKLEINKCYRTTGGILNAATLIREQKLVIPESKRFSLITDESSYFYYDIQEMDKLNEYVLYLLDNSMKKWNYTLDDILVISPVNENENGGAFELNNLIQERYNSDSTGFKQTVLIKNKKRDVYFRLNDRIMNNRNDYKAMVLVDYEIEFLRKHKNSSYEEFEDLNHELGFIANGEIGVIEFIFDEFIVVNFNGQFVMKSKEDLSSYQLGYAITTHKSQGSEAPCVITISTSNFSYMINCNHMYVGVTRAKKHCFHVGTAQTVNWKVKFRENKMRRTFLSEPI